MKKILSLILVLCLSLAISVTAFAAEIDTSGGTGSTPVELTTTNGGIGGGEDDIAPTKLSVTVPTALPMAMSDDGSVVTATGCKIVNNSYGPVRVKNVTISAANGWIEALAEECGVRFLNSYEALVGADGYLPESRQNGDGLHLTGEAYAAVMQYIRTHAYT